MARAILSYVPIVNQLLAETGPFTIELEPVEVHSIETAPEKRPRTLKHLLRGNHVNYSIVYHHLQYDNHVPHILCSAYLLGASDKQLHHIYEVETKELDPWEESPSEIVDEQWREYLGDKHYQRAYVDFFEDVLAVHLFNWRKTVYKFLVEGDYPLINGLIGGLGHPLIHLGYAFEMDNREIAMEALGLAAVQYNFLHQYLDDPSYTRPARFSATSPLELLNRLAADKRFDKLFDTPGSANIEPLFQKHESLVLEYWNSWNIESDPVKQFEASQEAAVALLTATVPAGSHSFNFFIVHLLTTSHAVRILLPFMPPKYHANLVRQWWLLVLAVYIAELRPRIDSDHVPEAGPGQSWSYVKKQAIESRWATDAHYVKAIRAMKEAARTWGDVHNRYLSAAVYFVDEFNGWVH